VGVRTETRDDKYTTVGIIASNFASQVGGLQTVSVDNVTITGNGTPANPLVAIASGEYTYEIGEYVPTEGGVIFHRWLSTTAGGPPTAGTIQNYLVVNTTDLSTSAQWASSNINISNVESTWDGSTNTTNLIAAGAGSGITSGTAAVLCNNLVSGGKSDWYLPAAYEMTTIWYNQFSVSRGLEQAGGQNLVFGANYATSTEIDSNSSYWFATLSGNSVSDVSMGGKGTSRYVRAVRRFSI
jgi:hypothetical protein